MKRLLAAFLLLPLPAVADWTRTGLELHARPVPPAPVVDLARVQAQKANRCAATSIRFGDTAAMRGTAPAEIWDDTARTNAAIAALSDRPQTAQAALDALPQDSAMADSQRILTALQFGQTPDVTGAETPGHAADRLFWQVMTDAPGATQRAWRDDLLPRLDAGFATDPSSFQIRAWRVIGWLRADPPGTCADRIADWSTRLLDLSEASACPLMLGHVTHAIDRALGSRPDTDPDNDRAVWRAFGDGMLAVVAGAPDVAAARRAEIMTSGTFCAPTLAAELTRLEALP